MLTERVLVEDKHVALLQNEYLQIAKIHACTSYLSLALSLLGDVA